MAKVCTSIQKSLGWCQGTPELPGVKRRIYFLAKSFILGYPQHPCNVYMVELPPPTEEELAEARQKAQENARPDDEPEELYGAWI